MPGDVDQLRAVVAELACLDGIRSEAVERRIAETVAAMPPFTDEERAELRRLLAPVRRDPNT